MTKWILIAAWIALLQPVRSAEAAPSVSCKLEHEHTTSRWRLASFEVVGTRLDDPPQRCIELMESMRETLDDLAPPAAVLSSVGRDEFHVWLADLSTPGTIRFEARAWAVSSEGRGLRHLTRAIAVSREPSRRRVQQRTATSAVNRALRELVSLILKSDVMTR